MNRISCDTKKSERTISVKAKKRDSSEKKKGSDEDSPPPLDEEIARLSPEEARWLDQRIKQAKLDAKEGRKKSSYEDILGESAISQIDRKKQPKVTSDKKDEIQEIDSSVIKPPSKPKSVDKEKIKVPEKDSSEPEPSEKATPIQKPLEKTEEDKKEPARPKEQKIPESDIVKETEQFSFDGYNIETSKRIDKAEKITEEFDLGIGDEPPLTSIDKIKSKKEKKLAKLSQKFKGKIKPSEIKKKEEDVSLLKKETVKPEAHLEDKTRSSFFEKPPQLHDETITKDEFDDGKPPTSSPKEVKLEEITPDNEIQFSQEANRLKTVALRDLGYTEATWEEIDFYPLHEPFAYVQIIRETETLDKRYILIEVELYEEESRILEFLKETLAGFSLDTDELESKGEEKYLIEKIDQIIEDYMIEIDTKSRKKIVYFLEKQFLGLDKLDALI